MTKDRISEMMQLMRENKVSPEPPESVPEEMPDVIKSFLARVQDDRNEVEAMRLEIEALKMYHNEIQKCTSETTRKDLEYKVEEKKNHITSSLVSVRNKLKSRHNLSSEKSLVLERIKKVQINSLVRTVNELTQDYYSCLVDHSEKCRKLLYEMISISNEDKSDFEDLLEKGKIAFFTNNLLLNEFEQKVHFRDIEDRHADILKVEKSVLELKDLTQGLSLAVEVQTEKIENVEQSVQRTAKKVENAAVIMKRASKLRNKARKRKLLIAIFCFSFVLIITGIMIWI